MKRKKIIQIQPPVLDNVASGVAAPAAKQLTPLELNSYHFDKKHTVLTPAVLQSKS